MFGKTFPSKLKQREMCALYQSGLRLADVAEKSSFCVTTVKKVLVLNGVTSRHRGTRRGTGKITKLDDASLVAFKTQWDTLESNVKGTIAENHVKNRLSEMGFDVWEPFCQNHKTDLLILDGQRLLRVQVKSATYDKKTKAFRANVTRHRRGGGISRYTLTDVDFFIVYCGGLSVLQFYVVPAVEVVGRNDLKLYPHRPKGNFPGGPDWERFNGAFERLRLS